MRIQKRKRNVSPKLSRSCAEKSDTACRWSCTIVAGGPFRSGHRFAGAGFVGALWEIPRPITVIAFARLAGIRGKDLNQGWLVYLRWAAVDP